MAEKVKKVREKKLINGEWVTIHRETGASSVKFDDGSTFQEKLDSGELKGPKGDQGAVGAQGTAGAPGKDGAAGAKGDTGDTWVPSVDASTGALSWAKNSGVMPQTVNIKGPQGATGPAGPTGPAGAKGTDGVSPTVKVSKSGTVTTVTFTDAAGDKVATINDGKNGANGTNGTNGKDGAAGARGSQWFSGTGVTGNSGTAAVFANSGVSSALVGDWYLNTNTGYVYTCTLEGVASVAKWVYKGSIKGVTGAAGPAGPAGAAGAKGDTGAAGPNTVSTSTGTNITGLLKGNGSKVAQAVADTDYLTPDTASGTYMPIKGGKFTGNVSGQYFTGTWLQTTAAGNLASAASKIAVLDDKGWVYYRTPAQILGDIGAVPTTRKVNGKALSTDISLSAADVSARPLTWTPTAADVKALPLAGGTMTGNIAMGSHKVTGLATPTASTDAATKGYVDGKIQYGTSVPATLADGVVYLVYE